MSAEIQPKKWLAEIWAVFFPSQPNFKKNRLRGLIQTVQQVPSWAVGPSRMRETGQQYTLGLRSISQSHENRLEILISYVIEQRIQCAITKITNTHSGATRSSRGLDSVSTSPQWQSSCCNLSRLAWPTLTLYPPPPPLAMVAARQHGKCGAKMINNNWQVLGVG